jgi:PAS domain S-box-containing protein
LFRIPSKVSARQQTRALTGLGLTLVAVISLLFYLQLRARVDAAIVNAELQAQNLAAVLAEHTARTFEALSRTLVEADTIRRDAEAGRYRSPEDVRAALRHLRKTAPAAIALGWTDSDGNLKVHTYERDPPRPNISDREHFWVQRDAGEGNFFVSPPFRSSSTGRWISAVSRRITNPDGSFAGVVTAPIDQAYFAAIYRSLYLGKNGTVSLAHTDRVVMITVPFAEDLVGKSFPNAELFVKRMPSASAGSYEASNAIDGRSRLVGYKLVPGLPLVVAVSYDRAEVLSRIFRQMSIYGSLGALLLCAIITGIAFLRRQAREIDSKNSLLEVTLHSMDDGLIVLDKSGRIPICNRRARELLGLPDDLMSGRPTGDAVLAYQTAHGEFARMPAAALARVRPKMLEERPHSYERERPNGTVIEVRTAPIPNGGVVRTYTDITERKRANERFEALLEAAPDAMVIVGADGTILLINAQAENLFGFSRQELLGQKVEILIPERLEARHRAHRGEFGVSGRTRPMRGGPDQYGRRKDGTEFPVEISLSPLRSGDDTIVLSSIRDISAQKAAEQALRDAKRRAEEAMAAKAEFLANMSHELRTPLTAVLGIHELLRSDPTLGPEQRSFVGMACEAGRSLLAIVNDILDFSKIEAGQLTIETIAFDLEPLVTACRDLVAEGAAKKGLTIDARLEGGPVMLLGDPTRLRQVILNLLTNAVKFTDKGGVRVVAQYRQDSGLLRVSVSDTGIGIAPEKLALVFERFSQADGSIARRYGGTGLGLTICKRLVELMGGRMDVRSEAGHGSTFSFELPLRRITAQDQPLPRPDNRPVQASSPMRVLLAEDNFLNQVVIAAMLEKLGHQVTVVGDGAAAVSAVGGDLQFDVVLMDVQMPGMDGLTATRAIREAEAVRKTRPLPIIGLTANSMSEDRDRCHAAGMDSHVAKPVEWKSLHAAIENATASTRTRTRANELGLAAPVVLDHKVLGELRQVVGEARLAQLLGIFVEETKRRNTEFSAMTLAELSAHTHACAGTAGQFGFIELSRLCTEIEAETRLGKGSERVAELIAACERAIDAALSYALDHAA